MEINGLEKMLKLVSPRLETHSMFANVAASMVGGTVAIAEMA
jgi:hypothetical protein